MTNFTFFPKKLVRDLTFTIWCRNEFHSSIRISVKRIPLCLQPPLAATARHSRV